MKPVADCVCRLVDASLVQYLKTGVQDGHLIFVATLDEASYQYVQSVLDPVFVYNLSLSIS